MWETAHTEKCLEVLNASSAVLLRSKAHSVISSKKITVIFIRNQEVNPEKRDSQNYGKYSSMNSVHSKI